MSQDTKQPKDNLATMEQQKIIGSEIIKICKRWGIEKINYKTTSLGKLGYTFDILFGEYAK